MRVAASGPVAPRPDEIDASLIDLYYRLSLQAGLAGRFRTLLAHPGRAARLVRFLRSLPIVTVAPEISCRCGLAEFIGPMSRRIGPLPHGLLAQSLLVVEMPNDMLRGRAKQALRTNLRRATAAELTVSEPSPREVASAVRLLLRRREYDTRTLERSLEQAGHPAVRTWVLRTASGDPLGFAMVVVVAQWARLLLSVGDDSAGRWLLHYTTVQQLRAAGVQYLLVDSALNQSPGLRYFQGRTGFRTYRLRLSRELRRAMRAIAAASPAVPPQCPCGRGRTAITVTG